MLDKLIKLLKIIIVSVIISVMLFGIYNKEYLTQAIPIYLQYLEQKQKWQEVNTKMYVYVSYRTLYPPAVLLFVSQGNITRYKIYETDFKLSSIASEHQTDKYLERTQTSINIDNLFIEINHLILQKLWDTIPFRSRSKSNDYRIEIIYNKEYGYPMMISTIYNEKSKSLYDNLWAIGSTQLKLLPKNTKYTNSRLKELLDLYSNKSNIYPKGKVIEEVGGDMIKGKIFQEE